ncbi:hypothetical protein LP415_27325 [Polaromonas sp. P1(28)-8]|nr:hypothetical protein LP415_27325 [Polaromonas sp. P1(28)-8]
MPWASAGVQRRPSSSVRDGKGSVLPTFGRGPSGSLAHAGRPTPGAASAAMD